MAERSRAAVDVTTERDSDPDGERTDGGTTGGTELDSEATAAAPGNTGSLGDDDAPGVDESTGTMSKTEIAAELEADDDTSFRTGAKRGAAPSPATSDTATPTASTESAAAGDSDSGTDAPGPVDTAEDASTGPAASVPHAADATTPDGSTPSAELPELHSGDKLADRYRLEECLGEDPRFSSWRAVDEKLRRAVGIHVLPGAEGRADTVIAAARSAALLPDPRFVHVLDAVRENGVAYVVREWLPDATDLQTLLASGPLEPYDAYQLIRQVSAAMAAAHRADLSHLRLLPKSVLRTDTGQYRLNGLAVDAALHGLDEVEHTKAERQAEDTRAVGALLYAALAHRWPYQEDAAGLSGVPRDLGLVPPDQVRAGVHRQLAELSMRALAAGDPDDVPHHSEALNSPQELADAVSGLPKIRPPEPDPSEPAYHSAGWAPYPARPAGAGDAPYPPRGQGGAPSSSTPAPPTLPGRTGRALKAVVTLVVLVALGLGSWQMANTMMSDDHSAAKGAAGDKQQDHKHGTAGKGDSQSAGAARPGKPLDISGATEFAPGGSPMKPDKAKLAVDGDPSTEWITKEFYGYSKFGNLGDYEQGSGIVVDLGTVRQVAGMKLALARSGQVVEVRAAAPSATSQPGALSGFPQQIEKAGRAKNTVYLNKASKPVKTRYVLVHITDLPSVGGEKYRGGISDIQVLGKK